MNIDSFFIPHFSQYSPLVYACLFMMLYTFVSSQLESKHRRKTIVDKESLWCGMVDTLQIVYLSVSMVLFLESIWNNWHPVTVWMFFILVLLSAFKGFIYFLRRYANS